MPQRAGEPWLLVMRGKLMLKAPSVHLNAVLTVLCLLASQGVDLEQLLSAQ